LEAVFVLLEYPSPSRRIFIGSHSLRLSGSPYWSFKKVVSRFLPLTQPLLRKRRGLACSAKREGKTEYGELRRPGGLLLPRAAWSWSSSAPRRLQISGEGGRGELG
jgi:hypothetical protein